MQNGEMIIGDERKRKKLVMTTFYPPIDFLSGFKTGNIGKVMSSLFE